MIISAVQQSDSVIHVHTSFCFRFFFHIYYHRILGRVPCAIQQDLIAYPLQSFMILDGVAKEALTARLHLILIFRKGRKRCFRLRNKCQGPEGGACPMISQWQGGQGSWSGVSKRAKEGAREMTGNKVTQELWLWRRTESNLSSNLHCLNIK